MRSRLALAAVAVSTAMVSTPAFAGDHSVARQWNEEMLEAIRNDYARPTVHARNLYHVSAAMWDAWAAYSDTAEQVIHHEFVDWDEDGREETISYAAYRILHARFAKSPGAEETLPRLDALMDDLGYDKDYTSTVGSTPAALGNRIAVSVLFYGLFDNSNEQGGYVNQHYEPINEPLLPDFPGNPDLEYPNRWQPLVLEWFRDQSGNIIIGGYPEFLSPEWGQVKAFALSEDDLTIYERDGFDYWVYHDPGPPPLLGGEGENYYKWGFEQVSIWSAHLDASDGVMWDISPGAIGNAELPEAGEWAEYYNLIDGGDWGKGYKVNPVTKEPYEPQMVPRGDYARILAEFWADGPDSETPPGHWFTILNYVNDHELFEKRIGGEGDVLDDLEWDVKVYLAMGGTMHDCAVAAWGVKGWYDYIRPVSALRWLCDNGQCSDPDGPSYHADGINLRDGLIEIITSETTEQGERHEHLKGHEGKVAIKAWLGHAEIEDPEEDVAGVGWMLAELWWPYQRPSFVTPPFAGYVSGHSTYSRAAAELMELMTGSPYFPGGLGEFHCPKGEFLVFEDGPSIDVTLQWASYHDASDQCSLSRIWGGIHPGADDIPGRVMGAAIGPDSWEHAKTFFRSRFCDGDIDMNHGIDFGDIVAILGAWGNKGGPEDVDGNGVVGYGDIIFVLAAWGPCE